MSKKNLEIIKNHWKEDIAPISYPVILQRTDKKLGEVWHNFRTGKESANIDDLTEGELCIAVRKMSYYCSVFKGNVLYQYITKSDSIAVAYDVVKHEGENFFAIYIVRFNLRTTLSSKDEKRNWEVIARMYIDNKKICYPQYSFVPKFSVVRPKGVKREDFFELPSYSVDSLYKWSSLWNVNNISKDDIYDKNLKENCIKMGWGIVTIGNNNRLEIMDPSNLFAFLKYKEPTKKGGNKQKKIEELTALSLEKVRVPRIVGKNGPYYDYCDKNRFANISKVEGVDTPMCCYRTFSVGIDGEVSEGARIYIEADGKYTACKKNNIGEWVNMTISCKNDNFAYKINYVNKKAVKGTVLEYLIPMLENEKKNNEVGVLIANTLKHPCIEILYKAGFDGLLKKSSKGSYGKLWDDIKDALGGINEKGKTLYSIIGVNKEQYTTINETVTPDKEIAIRNVYSFYDYDGPYQLIARLKICFDRENLSDIDINTFKEVLNLVIKAYIFEHEMYSVGRVSSSGKLCKETFYDAGDYVKKFCFVMGRIVRNNSIATLKAMIPKLEELFYDQPERDSFDFKWVLGEIRHVPTKVFVRTFDVYVSYVEMFDELYSYAGIEDRPNFSFHFQNLNHVRIMHDDIVPICNYYREIERLKRNEEKYKKEKSKWDKIKGEWEKWKYEDEEYAVIYPNDPCDLAVEGTTLGHCVGGYIDKVINRRTNILFIRRKEDIRRPFFTIEILDNGNVEQIHGRSNCNVSSAEVRAKDPNLASFINKWVKEKKLKLHNINKIR